MNARAIWCLVLCCFLAQSADALANDQPTDPCKPADAEDQPKATGRGGETRAACQETAQNIAVQEEAARHRSDQAWRASRKTGDTRHVIGGRGLTRTTAPAHSVLRRANAAAK